MSTPLQHFIYKKGSLTCQQIPLETIAKKLGTPVYVYSSEAFLSPLSQLQQGLQKLDHLVCFAMKSNSNLSILKLLSDAGAGMDLVSGGELFRAQLAGVPANRIVFSGVGKTAEEMTAALQYGRDGIFSFNVESAPELHLLNKVAKSLKRKASVALRFNPDVDAKTHPYISTGLKKNKFGMNRNEILKIAKSLGNLPGIEVKGLSIHIGSQLLSLSPLKDAFSRLQSLVVEMNSILKTPLSFVDLGGGIGITYKKEKSPALEAYCELVQRTFKDSKLKILIEPGRVLSGNSGILLTNVLFRKTRKDKDFIIVDAAMNDLMRPALYGSYHDIVPIDQARQNGKKKKTSIVGPVCETSDCFADDRLVSTSLKEGDTLAILSSGAYGFTMASNYNSRPRPPEVLIENGQYRIIRKREDKRDLIRGEDLGR